MLPSCLILAPPQANVYQTDGSAESLDTEGLRAPLKFEPTPQNYSQNIFSEKGEMLLLKQNQLKKYKFPFPRASAYTFQGVWGFAIGPSLI